MDGPAPALPAAFGVWSPSPQVRTIDLLSDVHLQASAPLTFQALSRHLLSTPAQQVLILGDLFEVWIGDDARHQAFEQRCVAMLQQAARTRRLAFMPGNRDFLVGQDLLLECGIERLPDPVVLRHGGQQVLLTHGDALCLEDIDYQRFRAQVRSVTWQAAFLARPLEERRGIARTMRDASQAHQARLAPGQYADVDAEAARAWLDASGTDTLIHGHTHRPGIFSLGHGRQRWVLGDWDFDAEPHRARALRLGDEHWHSLDIAAGTVEAVR